ncbi:potassium transporter [Tepiditoga spiralis]|uniref:Potassium transporter n=1 Tax=Tepiditoga spiralis TaxID=2108365 RepID=A0A7G1G832_9BACT|nr:TrkH family potassium uptake protein [Tepiditoga spiralis]BBE31374.1 potassium transporter [Tepiditoga spiralis]
MSDYKYYLKLRYKTILKNTASMLFALSLLIFLVGSISIFYGDFKTFNSFFMTTITTAGFGLILMLFSIGEKSKIINVQDAVMIIFFVWTFSIFFSSLPFVYYGMLNIHQAIFESTSGWTTTGLTMISNVEIIPKTFLLWRSIMQYIGGAGFALIMVIVAGSTGVGLYQAEGRTDNIVPNLRGSAKIITLIYVSWAILGIVLLMLISKLPFFEAFNHTLTALATGGFSTKNASVGAFNNLSMDIIIMILMIAGGTGFGVHYAFLLMTKNFYKNIKDYKSKKISKLKLKDRISSEPYLKNPEPKTMYFLLFISIILIFLFMGKSLYGVGNGLRHSAFQAISALTGTGFSTVSFLKWNPFGILVMIILMILGGMMDSTSGGLKLYRVYVIIKVIKLQILNFFKPQGTKFHVEVYKGVSKKFINESTFKDVIAVIFMYFLIFFIGVFTLLGYGYNLQDSMFEYSSALSAVGLSVGITSPTAPLGVIWIETIGMYLGRLEFFVIYYAIIKLIKDLKEFI